MTIDWNSGDINPTGIKQVTSGNQPKNVQVGFTAKAHAYFTDDDGNKFVCVLIDSKKRVFRFSNNGYNEEVLNGLKFTIVRMTEEILEK